MLMAPEEFHLVIVDNGRSEILGSQFKRYSTLYPLWSLSKTPVLLIVISVVMHMALFIPALSESGYFATLRRL